MIPPDLLSIFDYQELDMLLCGLPDINVEDWKAHTEYIGEYARSKDKHRVIKWFWKVCHYSTQYLMFYEIEWI